MFKPRELYPEISAHLEKQSYSIITGARQVGKTMLLRRLYQDLKTRNYRIFYITFEDLDVLSQINTHPEHIFRFAPRPPDPLESSDKLHERLFLFIDEVQYAADPAGFLKYLYDTYLHHLKIVATGSSAFYLDSKFRDSLAGRKKIFHLKTLSFAEFLQFNDRDDLYEELRIARSRRDYISLKRAALNEHFEEYLVYGGYPAVALENNKQDKQDILIELRNAFIKRDIDEADIQNETYFYQFMSLLAAQTGNLVNKNELANTTGINRKTLGKYLITLQKCFYIALINPFYKNIRKELKKMPKVYFLDNGMRNVLLNQLSPFSYRPDKGQLLENYVYNRLIEKFPHLPVKYWRTADETEIDFIVADGFLYGYAYEVKQSGKNVKPGSYKNFQKNYPGIDLKIIAYNPKGSQIPIMTF